MREETGALWTKVRDWNLLEASSTAPQTTRAAKFTENFNFLEGISFTEIAGSLILDSDTWKNI